MTSNRLLALVPAVGDVLDALGGLEGCRLARMSGSGATCFGVFTTTGRGDGAERLRSRRPTGGSRPRQS
jgi:4-diphosphocytidyl-2-C-methyl-D-erythritol kinase